MCALLRSRFIDSVGDGSGSINLNVNGSVTPVIFRYTPSFTDVVYIRRLIFYLSDTGTLDSGGFGNGAALTNGIEFMGMRNVGLPSEFRFTDGSFRPIKTNTEWQSYAHDIIHSSWGTGDESYSVRYTLEKDGTDLALTSANLDEFWIIINDDLSGISDVRCKIGAWSRR